MLFKSRDKANDDDEAKVIGRRLYIGEQRFNSENIPGDLVHEQNDGNEFIIIMLEM